MDPGGLATSAVAALATLFGGIASSAASAAGERIGEVALERLGAVYRLVKTRLAGDALYESSLERVRAEPDSQARQRVLEGVLTEVVGKDPTFAADLARLLAEVRMGAGDVQAVESGAVAGRDVRQRGGVVAGRDVTIGGQQESHPRQRWSDDR
jgi:hypothetical protein